MTKRIVGNYEIYNGNHGLVYVLKLTCPVCGKSYKYQEQVNIKECSSCGAKLKPIHNEEDIIRYVCGG